MTLDTITDMDLWSTFLDSDREDESYTIGEKGDEITSFGRRLGDLLGTVGEGEKALAVYRNESGLALVADSTTGPWVVYVNAPR